MKLMTYSERRYIHHHAEWSKAKNDYDYKLAARHLYALRAHLRQLGWLAKDYDVPGYGVRTMSDMVPCHECGTPVDAATAKRCYVFNDPFCNPCWEKLLPPDPDDYARLMNRAMREPELTCGPGWPD